MTNKRKVVNDPVYGFITIPYDIVFDLMEHPYFQRLRRIKQLGLTHYVYPGALNTRFHHALGAMHLMTQAIKVLRLKGVDITEEEAKAVTIAILLHDIGHGPFSHALEHTIVNIHHETLSLVLMQKLNEYFDGQLSLAIQIFKNKYPKKFLYQLVSSQLDMDRMDYLSRDSFFTGVIEGRIGYDRIIKMLAVENNNLVIEEKGIYSIEKFLIARRIMYWQVYLHKAVLSAEQMLIKALKRAKLLAQQGNHLVVSKRLQFFLYNDFSHTDLVTHADKIIAQYVTLDDVDIMDALKNFITDNDPILAFLAYGLVYRRLFALKLNNVPYPSETLTQLKLKAQRQLKWKVSLTDMDYIVFTGAESNNAYNAQKEAIYILSKDRKVNTFSAFTEHNVHSKEVIKYFLCHPKSIRLNSEF